MKIVCCGDAHLDVKVGGYDMHVDIVRALEHVETACMETGAGLRVLLGDMFHGNRPTPRAWASFMDHLFSDPRVPTIVVPGNHDHAAYDPVRAVQVHNADNMNRNVRVSWLEGSQSNVNNLVVCPRWPSIVEHKDGWKVLVVPYVHNPAAMNEFGCTAQELVDLAFSEALKLGSEVKAAFCHLDVDGAKAGTEGAYLRGGKLQIPMDLAKRCNFPVIDGHVHRRQKMGNVFMPGSLVPTDFGDADGPGKGYAVVEV